VIDDRLARDKDREAFARVFDTKTAGAAALAAGLRDGARFLCFLSSVAGAFGNRGQADYAAANDFVDKLALALSGRSAARVLSVAWGPWAGGGMVSPELAAEFERRGIGLIDPDEGIEALFEELSGAVGRDPQVILACADLTVLA